MARRGADDDDPGPGDVNGTKSWWVTTNNVRCVLFSIRFYFDYYDVIVASALHFSLVKGCLLV